MAAPFAERSLNTSLETLELIIRYKRQRRTGEAAAVDADSTFTAEKLLAESDGERHVLLLDIPCRGHVLQQRPRRKAGFIDVVQKCGKIVVFQRPHRFSLKKWMARSTARSPVALRTSAIFA